MNTLILYAMGIASLVVIIAGAFFVVVMIVYYIQVMWSKISACANNTMEYLRNKQDFEVYKADVLRWDTMKREKALKCRECAYRKKYMDALERRQQFESEAGAPGGDRLVDDIYDVHTLFGIIFFTVSTSIPRRSAYSSNCCASTVPTEK